MWKILQATDLTFKKAVETALVVETLKLDNHEILGISTGKKTTM